MKKLPATWQGVPLARGLGMKSLEDFVDKHSIAEWPTGAREFFLVVANDPSDIDVLGQARAFPTLTEATRYARGLANGNIDWRVLRCSSALLVIATENEL